MTLFLPLLKICVTFRHNSECARVVKWHTRMLEVHVPQGVEVRLLSRAPLRKLQVLKVRLAEFIRPFGGLGGQFVLDFGGKNELAILKEEKKNF